MIGDPPEFTIRSMKRGDLLALDQIDPNFESDGYLAVETVQHTIAPTFRLVERPFEKPFVKEVGYRYDGAQLEQARYRLEQAESALMLVAEAGRRLVGILEVEGESWRNTALIWALFVDQAWRGRGVGRAFLNRVEEWARAEGYRALVLETQTNNLPAIRFYHRHGYHITGLDTHFYTNTDVERREVALFMYKELEGTHRNS
ncbi:MAG: GNAT family N-acetyltransferase [Ardenticatenaceae bacterium]